MLRLRASSLFYAVVVATLIGLCCMGFISYLYIHSLEIHYFQTDMRMKHEVLSTLELLKSKQITYTQGEAISSPYTGNSKDSIQYKKLIWGSYDVIFARCWFKKNRYESAQLLGVKPSGILKNTALYCCNNERSIGVSGSTQIIGDVWVSPSGFKRNYIERSAAESNTLHNGSMHTSSNQLPELNKSRVSYINTSRYDLSNDSILDNSQLTSIEIHRSFAESSITFFSNSTIYVNSAQLDGNIKIVSKSKIVIDKSSSLNNILLIAPHIVIKEKADLCAQLIAEDSIQIEKEAVLRYPSSLLVLPILKTQDAFLSIAEGVTIQGEIFVLPSQESRSSFCILESSSLVYGLAYINAYTMPKGRIIGSLFAKQLIYKNASGVFENQLVNTQINRSNLSKHFLLGNLLEQSNEKYVLSWLAK